MWLLIFSIVTVVVAGRLKQQAIPGPGQVPRPGRDVRGARCGCCRRHCPVLGSCCLGPGAVPLVVLQLCQAGARRAVRCSHFPPGEEVLP